MFRPVTKPRARDEEVARSRALCSPPGDAYGAPSATGYSVRLMTVPKVVCCVHESRRGMTLR